MALCGQAAAVQDFDYRFVGLSHNTVAELLEAPS